MVKYEHLPAITFYSLLTLSLIAFKYRLPGSWVMFAKVDKVNWQHQYKGVRYEEVYNFVMPSSYLSNKKSIEALIELKLSLHDPIN